MKWADIRNTWIWLYFVSVSGCLKQPIEWKPYPYWRFGWSGGGRFCSYEAGSFGVHSAMPMRKAATFARGVWSSGVDFEKYSQNPWTSPEIHSGRKYTLLRFLHRWVFTLYIERGMYRVLRLLLSFSQQIRARNHQRNRICDFLGLIGNKTRLSRTGESKPNNAKQILQGEEKTFPRPLSVRNPMIGEKGLSALYTYGRKSAHTPANAANSCKATFPPPPPGKNGTMIWRKANGNRLQSRGDSYSERQVDSTETTFEQEHHDVCVCWRRTLAKAMNGALTGKAAAKTANSRPAWVYRLAISDFDYRIRVVPYILGGSYAGFRWCSGALSQALTTAGCSSDWIGVRFSIWSMATINPTLWRHTGGKINAV